jgi:hypothetical protein
MPRQGPNTQALNSQSVHIFPVLWDVLLPRHLARRPVSCFQQSCSLATGVFFCN